MYSVTVQLAALDSLPDGSARAALEQFLRALAFADLAYLRSRGAPPLYESGVRYFDDNETDDRWVDVPTVLERGYGHCADLAAWRCAELWASGVRATPFIVQRDLPARTLYHAVVRNGWRTEDPSVALGMTP